MRKHIGIAASVGVLASIGAASFIAFGHGREALASAPPAPPAAKLLVAPGVTEGASDVVELSFQTAGSVAEVAADAGARVKTGDVLARLDDRLARAQLEEAVAALSAAKARRDATFAGSRTSERAVADAELAEVKAAAADRTRELERSERLLAQDAVGSAEVDRNRTAVEIALAQAQSAEARARLVHQGSRAEALREATANVAAAEARRVEAETLLSHTVLTSPCDCMVLRRRVEPGEQTALVPPTIAFTLVNVSKLRVRAEIDEQDIALVHVGQAAWTTAPAFGDKQFPGKVVQLMSDFGRKQITTGDPHARNDTRVLEVLIELDGPPSLPIGLRMDTHITQESPKP